MKQIIEPTGTLFFAGMRPMASRPQGKRIGVIISGGNIVERHRLDIAGTRYPDHHGTLLILEDRGRSLCRTGGAVVDQHHQWHIGQLVNQSSGSDTVRSAACPIPALRGADLAGHDMVACWVYETAGIETKFEDWTVKRSLLEHNCERFLDLWARIRRTQLRYPEIAVPQKQPRVACR